MPPEHSPTGPAAGHGAALHENAPDDRRAARRARPAPARRPPDRPGPDDGGVPRRPPVADAPRPSRVRRGRRVAVRQPDAVQRRGAISPPTRATSTATPRWPRSSASTTCSRRPSRRLSRWLRHDRVASRGVTELLEGAHRGRAHFDGVATVVSKLFNIVGARRRLLRAEGRPAGARDRRLVRDLDIPVRIEVCPTVREPDGLALSSRNVHSAPAERERATALQRALSAVAGAVAAGERDAATALARRLAELTRARDRARLPADRQPTRRLLEPIDGRRRRGRARAGRRPASATMRLIDNHARSRRAHDRASTSTTGGDPAGRNHVRR